MARIKARERSAWQDDPNWTPLAKDNYIYLHPSLEPRMVEPHRLRVADHNFVRQPNIARAELAANVCLLMGVHLPVEPLLLLTRMRVQIYSYHEVASYLQMTHSEFEAKYGMKDGFTVRLKDKKGELYWAVAYRNNVSNYRRRFTLAHELGHIVLNHIGTLHADEIEADFFASCLLAPRVAMEDLPRDAQLAKRCGITARQARQARCRRPHPMPRRLQYHLRRWYHFELLRKQEMAAVHQRCQEVTQRVRQDRLDYVNWYLAEFERAASEEGICEEEVAVMAEGIRRWGKTHIVGAPIDESAYTEARKWNVRVEKATAVPRPRPHSKQEAKLIRDLMEWSKDVYPLKHLRPAEPIYDGLDWGPIGVEDFVVLLRRYDQYMPYSEHLPKRRTKKRQAAEGTEAPQPQENQGSEAIEGAEKGESPEKT